MQSSFTNSLLTGSLALIDWSEKNGRPDSPSSALFRSQLNRRVARHLRFVERFARSVLEQATEAVVVLSPDGRITHASWRAEQLAARPPVGCMFSEAFPLEGQTAEEAGTLARFSAESLDAMLATKPFHGVEVKLRGGGNARFAPSAQRGAAGRRKQSQCRLDRDADRHK